MHDARARVSFLGPSMFVSILFFASHSIMKSPVEPDYLPLKIPVEPDYSRVVNNMPGKSRDQKFKIA